MIAAAIYSRKSTEQTGSTDEEKSVARQIDHSRQYAARKGWSVSEDHVFVDDGISGAEFVKRPGFIRLMNALKPRPNFQALIMSEESRLGRESIETSYALKQITDAGVRVFFYLEDRERTLDNAMDKVMLSLSSFASEMERERAKQRTYDAMRRKATAGHVTGGKTFGYDNREILSTEGQRLHVVRVINPTEAAIVRQIFEMYAGGLGIGRIAKRLNEERIPAPRKSSRGWAPSALHEMVRRSIYKGEIVWNEHQKIDRGGTKKRRRRDEKDFVRVDAPDLRIISPELWEKVQRRLAKAKGKGQSANRDQESKYLLTGMARCAHCGGPMQIVGANYHREKGRFYACSYYKKRGAAICKNSLLVEQEVLDRIVLKSLEEAFTEEMIKVAVEKALEKHRAGKGVNLDRRTKIERELSLIETYEKNIVDAIAKGQEMDPLLVKLKAEEDRRKELVKELEALEGTGTVASLDEVMFRREIRKRLANIRGLLERHVSSARRLLKTFLDQPLRFEAVQEGTMRRYRILGSGSYLPLLASSEESLLPSAWCPQRDPSMRALPFPSRFTLKHFRLS
jgi:DNA invertase Pin-like site-specific DNA recombinase/ssDNA-binding Zn-finger/Zn-ribbon topoisomerase 1